MRLEATTKAPDFTTTNQNSKKVKLSDFKGKFVILYFYPKDMTKGCTIEANDFSALSAEFGKLGAEILGVSPDNEQSHQKFIVKENLKINLLCDENHKIAESYGAWGLKKNYGKEYEGIIRSTFIIKDGIILKAFYNVKAANHAQKVLESLKNIIDSANPNKKSTKSTK
ncbi:thioredoxin-dependent thiol peroxidase [Helicobacter sp. 23-1044]